MLKPLIIRDVILDNNVVMAPMAGVSNQSFRALMKEFEVGLVCGEMVSDHAINYRNPKTLAMCEVRKDEHPMSLQLFGSDIESVTKAAIYLDQETDCDIIDFNMGCPAPKIVNNNSGSALMKDLDHAYKIVKSIVESVSKPVTVKFRSGYDKGSINAVECAKLMEKAGASALIIHPRTKTQMYNGKADYQIIKAVKASVKIPVIGNGDIKSLADAKRMLTETGCDGIMIGRAAIGNPWLIKEIIVGLANQATQQEISLDERYYYIEKHFNSLIKLKGEHLATLQMRTHIAYYISGLLKSKRIKDIINQLDNKVRMLNLLKIYFKILDDEKNALTSIDDLVSQYVQTT